MATARDAPQSRVAVVVLDHNGAEDTVACLASLERMDWEPFRVIVVDNGSREPLTATVGARFPAVEVLRSDQNLGFAGGNNLAIRRALAAGADHVLLLNNDTIADPGLLRSLTAAAAAHPEAGALCPLILYADPPDRVWYAGGRFDARRGRNHRHVGYGHRCPDEHRNPYETEYATGAAVLIRRSALERVGLLDDTLFLQVEDVDWSLRARAAGLRILVVPDARLWHRVSAASGGERSPSIAYYSARNTFAVCERHVPLTGLAARRRRAWTLTVHLVHARRARRPLANARAVIAGWRDFRRGRLGPRGARG